MRDTQRASPGDRYRREALTYPLRLAPLLLVRFSPTTRMGFWHNVLAAAVTLGALIAHAQAQYALTGRVLGAGAVTSTSGDYALVGGVGPGVRNNLAGGTFQLRGSVVPRAVISKEAESQLETPAPDHWWKLDGDLRDAVTGESAQAVNGESFAPGRVQQAFDFRGTNYLDLGSTHGNFGDQNFTITLWMKAEARVVSPTVLSWRESCTVLPHWRLRLTAQNFSAAQPGFSFYSRETLGPAVQLELAARPRNLELNVKDNRWHHVAVARDGANIVVYRDGQPFLAGNSRQTAVFPSQGHLIAGLDPCSINKPWANDPRLFDNPLIGQLDEIKIFRRTLTPSQIANEWKQSRPIPVTSLSPSHIEFAPSGAAPGVFRWYIDPLPGQVILAEELAGVQLEASPDLLHWSPLPHAVRLAAGRIELADGEAFLKQGCFYRVVFR